MIFDMDIIDYFELNIYIIIFVIKDYMKDF